MPFTPFIVNGTVTGDDGNGSNKAVILLTSPSYGTSTGVAETDGTYTIDMANVGYTSGETITYKITDRFLNEEATGSFVVTGGAKVLNVTTSVITDPKAISANRHVMIVNIGGKPVSRDNPLPVKGL